jgi:hypothetical protein
LSLSDVSRGLATDGGMRGAGIAGRLREIRVADDQTLPLAWDWRRAAEAAGPHLPWRRILRVMLVSTLALYSGASAVRIYARKYYIFLPDYLRQSVRAAPAPQGRPLHVFFLFVDHFEPDGNVERTRRWAASYVTLASRHRDSVGRPPQHTWFYPGEQLDDRILTILQRLMSQGFG